MSVLLLACLIQDPATRFELGQRLRAFEAAWAAYTDPALRRHAAGEMQAAVEEFFRGDYLAAGAAMDRARRALRTREDAASAWADSWWFRPRTRCAEAAAELGWVEVRAFYPTTEAAPDGARVLLELFDAAGVSQQQHHGTWSASPWSLEAPWRLEREGDYRVTATILAGESSPPLARWSWTGSYLPAAAARLESLREFAVGLAPGSDEAASLGGLVQLLETLHQGETLETDYPAAGLLAQAEAWRAALQGGETFLGPARPGQFWLTLATPSRPVPVRLQVPAGAAVDGLLPLVIALHGAGGSENLFFDGYGAGAAARACAARGWLLLAPRSGFGGVPLLDLIEALARHYPVDRARVFVIGHSMGAMQALAAVMPAPGRFAAVAALGGGGGVQRSAELAALPFFVAAGELDFAKAGARRLKAELAAAGVRTLEYREYPAAEHMTVVQEALPEVFAFFDRAAR